MKEQRWHFSIDHNQLCQVIEVQTLWDETTCRIWLPRSDSVVSIPSSRLKHIESAGIASPDNITYVAAAALTTNALNKDVILASIESM